MQKVASLARLPRDRSLRVEIDWRGVPAPLADDEIVVGAVETQNFLALLLQAGRVVACARERLTAILADRAPLSRDEALRLVRSPL